MRCIVLKHIWTDCKQLQLHPPSKELRHATTMQWIRIITSWRYFLENHGFLFQKHSLIFFQLHFFSFAWSWTCHFWNRHSMRRRSYGAKKTHKDEAEYNNSCKKRIAAALWLFDLLLPRIKLTEIHRECEPWETAASSDALCWSMASNGVAVSRCIPPTVHCVRKGAAVKTGFKVTSFEFQISYKFFRR